MNQRQPDPTRGPDDPLYSEEWGRWITRLKDGRTLILKPE